jgi:hypothetical protein
MRRLASGSNEIRQDIEEVGKAVAEVGKKIANTAELGARNAELAQNVEAGAKRFKIS